MSTFTLERGWTPLLVSLPHVGTQIPDDLKPRYVERALALEDTDWHLERLYKFVLNCGASRLHSQVSRYVIDLNRPPDDQPMYAGANNTALCPTQFFAGDRLYRAGAEPDRNEVLRRLALYWQPYHDALAAELERIRSKFGYAILFDGHSIRSELPWLFEGRLPDLNLGTADGASCSPELQRSVERMLRTAEQYTHVVNGRFKGGYITRHYGKPAKQVHAVQLEMCWSTYMLESPPYEYEEAFAEQVRPVLANIIDAILAWRPDE